MFAKTAPSPLILRVAMKEKKKKKLPKKEETHKKDDKKKIQKVMTEFKEDTLHSGSKKGPLVKNPKQAIAIALSESKKKKKK